MSSNLLDFLCAERLADHARHREHEHAARLIVRIRSGRFLGAPFVAARLGRALRIGRLRFGKRAHRADVAIEDRFCSQLTVDLDVVLGRADEPARHLDLDVLLNKLHLHEFIELAPPGGAVLETDLD